MKNQMQINAAEVKTNQYEWYNSFFVIILILLVV